MAQTPPTGHEVDTSFKLQANTWEETDQRVLNFTSSAISDGTRLPKMDCSGGGQLVHVEYLTGPSYSGKYLWHPCHSSWVQDMLDAAEDNRQQQRIRELSQTTEGDASGVYWVHMFGFDNPLKVHEGGQSYFRYVNSYRHGMEDYDKHKVGELRVDTSPRRFMDSNPGCMDENFLWGKKTMADTGRTPTAIGSSGH
ncbi:hypothetical protein OEZ85_002722 [Tetradesmus obliquus]|uniref:Uncharacterized protein n=1 Tax=Tetradesmus obliquus TaxID=3088 RepID=A0ABY8U0M8_TETOB|nr:hypothetical protein OEZ85_002722 [Tetradesmus obliquus]